MVGAYKTGKERSGEGVDGVATIWCIMNRDVQERESEQKTGCILY